MNKDKKTNEFELALKKYKEGEVFKDYFVSMKELSSWLKEQNK